MVIVIGKGDHEQFPQRSLWLGNSLRGRAWCKPGYVVGLENLAYCAVVQKIAIQLSICDDGSSRELFSTSISPLR